MSASVPSRWLATIAVVGWRQARRLPPVARLEKRLYAELEARVHSGQVLQRRGMVLLDALLYESAVREVLGVQADYRVLDVDHLDDADRKFLATRGYREDWLLANRPFRIDGDGKEAVEVADADFHCAAVRERGISITGPRSGHRLKSDRSLLAHAGQVVFFRFVDAEDVFYLAVGREGRGYVKLYVYVPRLHAVIILGRRGWSWLGRWEIDRFRAFLVAHHREVLRYLAQPAASGTSLLVDQEQFAHHIWNTLTGLQTLVRCGAQSLAQEVLVTREPVGPLERLFPELQGIPIERVSDGEVPKRVLRHNLFVLRPGGTVVDDELVERIYRLASQMAAPDVVTDATAFRQAHWPVLWVTLRAGSRTWVSQAEGIVALALALKARYPRLGLIIDGYVIQHGEQPNRQQRTLIGIERDMVDAIRARLDGVVETRSMVGRPLLHSVLFARVIDLYLAHHGTLQNKIGWLSNRPGVVHSNRSVLAGLGGTRRYYAAFTSRQWGVAPVYLDPELVTDADGSLATKADVRWNDPMQNYDFDWRHAHARLCEILAGLSPDAACGR